MTRGISRGLAEGHRPHKVNNPCQDHSSSSNTLRNQCSQASPTSTSNLSMSHGSDKHRKSLASELQWTLETAIRNPVLNTASDQ